MAAKIRIGFVGAGFMGQLAHIRSYALLRDECELVALAEPRQRTAQLVARRYDIDRVYHDHMELVESEELDAIVAVQRYSHHAALLPDLYPRVPYLFTEKPLASSPAEADMLAALAQASGCTHMVGCHRRSDPATREAKRTVDEWKSSGDVGPLRYLRVCYPDGDWIANAHVALIDAGEDAPARPPAAPPPEFADEEARYALATSSDTLVHPLNLLRHLLGERLAVSFVHASGRLLVFESESGIPATVEVTPYRTTVDFDEEILVAFERGYVRLRPAPSLALRRAGEIELCRDPGGDAQPQRIRPRLPRIDPMQAQAADFLRVCRGEARPPTDAAEAAEDLRLVAEVVRAQLEQPGARTALRVERAAGARAWEERLRAMQTDAQRAGA